MEESRNPKNLAQLQNEAEPVSPARGPNGLRSSAQLIILDVKYVKTNFVIPGNRLSSKVLTGIVSKAVLVWQPDIAVCLCAGENYDGFLDKYSSAQFLTYMRFGSEAFQGYSPYATT